MPDLSIIVPCYNEAKNIPIILEKFFQVLRGCSAELLLVNNGSTDESAEVFSRELKNQKYNFARVVNVSKNIGYGHGIMAGLKEAGGNILAWTHADLQTDPRDAVSAYKEFCKLGRGNKIVVKGRRINRKFGEWVFTLGMSCLASAVLRKLLYDINAQPKMFQKSFLAMMKDPPNDFSLDLYALYIAKHYGYSVHTIPVHFKERVHGESKSAASFTSRCKTIIRTIRYIFALRAKTASDKI